MDSPLFIRWFRQSKVVDTQGSPLVVYHATRLAEPIRSFDVPAYVSSNSAFAELLGDKATYPVYLRIENPYRLDGLRDGSRFKWDAADVAHMKARGYDGVIIARRGGEDIFTVFDADQVKSALDNRDTFSFGWRRASFAMPAFQSLPAGALSRATAAIELTDGEGMFRRSAAPGAQGRAESALAARSGARRVAAACRAGMHHLRVFSGWTKPELCSPP